jgi:hypothetical protein
MKRVRYIKLTLGQQARRRPDDPLLDQGSREPMAMPGGYLTPCLHLDTLEGMQRIYPLLVNILDDIFYFNRK